MGGTYKDFEMFYIKSTVSIYSNSDHKDSSNDYNVLSSVFVIIISTILFFLLCSTQIAVRSVLRICKENKNVLVLNDLNLVFITIGLIVKCLKRFL